jgi:hypothetical protein
MSWRGDPRPERERYQTASLAEQVRGELKAMRRHPGVVLAFLLVLGGGLVLNLLRPQVIGIRDVAAGDCLYIRAADAARDAVSGGRAIGTDSAVVRALYEVGAERASCDLSHSHEAISTTEFPEPVAAPYPGESALKERLMETCTTGFETFVGRALVGSELDMVIAVPDESAWNDANRVGACLVARRDGEYLSGRAQGSAR